MTKKDETKSLKEALQIKFAVNFDLKTEMPELDVEDLNIIEVKEIDSITLYLCIDEDEEKYIIREDTTGFHGIGLFDTRDDQLTFAAWNADFDIKFLADWVSANDIKVALKDAKKYSWGGWRFEEKVEAIEKFVVVADGRKAEYFKNEEEAKKYAQKLKDKSGNDLSAAIAHYKGSTLISMN